MTTCRTCPVCDEAEGKMLPGPSTRWRYRRCLRCAHMWLDPMPTPEDLRAYYNGAYQVPRNRYAARVPAAYSGLRRTLSRGAASGRRLLEIGCSYGEMLARFAGDGWAVAGIELDQRACDEARRLVGDAVFCGTLQQFAADAEVRYDVILALHVVEHILDPAAFIARALSLLAPGGVLLLKTPNADAPVARLAAGWWEWAAPPEHVHLFSARSLRALLTRAGATHVELSSRQGDANGLALELLRSGAKRLTRRAATGGTPAAGVTPLTHRPWFVRLAAADKALETPIDRALTALSHDDRQLGAELTVVARAGSAS